ncbi:hypothetical protein Poli38472_004124 [Pythium oligandrum]|uniref:Endonuclease/exonuclease/phosphatase domain-containing protein n=1 Tax=Pythium oligandrum TaxID=41045 RepID=A0A8K1FMK2_PYTOL|nr:hypothetical protein Poli38472_004124 [Pythium oligandrum]|eukprot:TMW66359.1 hypothetical protein Poli38472_004124 [Pythium oligandrum]
MLSNLLLAAASIALLALQSEALPSYPNAGAPLKVMSFNLRTTLANDPCPSGCWAQRKSRVQRLLSRYQPDFIGTQEGAPDQIAFFTNELKYLSFGECAGDCQWNERNSIFYDSTRWQILEGYTFALSDTPEVIPSNTWNLEYLRAAVLARFEDRQLKHTVCMLNTHYDITRGQEQSSLLVAKRLAAFCRPSDTVLVTGDLNTPPATPPIQYLLNQASLSSQRTPIPLYETLTTAGAGGSTWIGGSFSNQTTGNKLDYIFTRRDVHTCLRDARILLDTFDGFTCSDHAVIMAEFALGTQSHCK